MKGQKHNDSCSPQEAAAIFYGIYNGLTLFSIYLILNPGADPEKDNIKFEQWKQLKRISTYIKATKARRKGEEEERKMGTKPQPAPALPGQIDFTDRDQFIKYLNEAANAQTDEKLKNDLLKMLSDHLDFKDDSKRSEDNEVKRFYLPVRCCDCSLYKAAQAGMEQQNEILYK